MQMGYCSLALERMNYVQTVFKLLNENVNNSSNFKNHINLLSVDLFQVFEIYYKAVLVKINNLDYNATEKDINENNIKDVYKRIALKYLIKSHNLIDLENAVPAQYRLFNKNLDLLRDIRSVYFVNRYQANAKIKNLNFKSYFRILLNVKRNIVSLYDSKNNFRNDISNINNSMKSIKSVNFN